MVILELIHAESPRLLEGMYLLDPKPARASAGCLVIHDNCSNRMAFAPAVLHSNFCPINFRWYGSGPTMVATGDGELGFDSGEGA